MLRKRVRWFLVAAAIPTALLALALILAVATTPAGVERFEDDLRVSARAVVRVPIEGAWAMWTTDGRVLPWAFGAVVRVDGRVGGQFCIETPENGYKLACGRVLEVDEPNRFVITFKACDLDDRAHRLTMEYTSVPQGTNATLTMDQFESATRTFQRFRRATPLLLAGMRDELEGGGLSWRTGLYTTVFGALIDKHDSNRTCREGAGVPAP